MVYGLWSMVYGLWSMVYGLWSMVYGLWTMVYGLWSMVYGLWSMVYGLWSMVYGLSKPGTTPSVVRLAFDSPYYASESLSFARYLAHTPGMEAVFVRPDLTTAERTLFGKLYQQKRNANKALGDQLDKPHRRVVREDRIRRIDVIESAKRKTSVYADP